MYAYYADDAQHTQFVMPKSDLSALNGKTITSLTFYSTGGSWTSTGTFTMKLNNSISSTSIGTNFINTSSWTTYFTGTVTINSDGSMTIPVSGNFTYNSSYPLWIDFQLPEDDKNYSDVYFYGQNKSSATGLYTNSSSISEGSPGTSVSFLPKTTFTYTISVTTPTVTTDSQATSITSNSATCGGNLNSTGGASTTRGICYMQGTSGTPTTSNTCVSAGLPTTSTGTFTVNLTGLSAGTTYRYRAYATNSAGTSYGNTCSFTTSSVEPSAATIPYSCNFENSTERSNWTAGFGNGGTNNWCVGTAAYNSSSYGMYITNNNGTSNAYTNTTIQYSYAKRKVTFSTTGDYRFSFSWRCTGEGNWDNLRAFLVPTSATLTGGTANGMSGNTNTTPSGWTDVSEVGVMNGQSSWKTSTKTINVTSGTYYLVFFWKNDDSEGSLPGAVDDISITAVPANASCSTATNLPCGTSGLAGTTVGTPGTAHGLPLPSDVALSNYGVWYKFTGDGNQTTVTVNATGYDSEIAIVSGSCGNFTWVGSHDGGNSSSSTDTYTFITTLGTNYFVYVAYYSSSGTSSNTGAFTISRTCESSSHTLTVNASPTAGGTVKIDNGTAAASVQISVANGSSHTITATPATGYYFSQWNDGSTDNPRTVTVTGDVTYTATFVQAPHTIASATDWNNFCTAVNSGYTYSGETVTMTNDITVTEMAGTESNKFKGTFDGGCNTITFNKSGVSDQYCAPFRFIDGATIQNLHLTGSVTTTNKFAGGIVAHAMGRNTITNCVNSTTINASNSSNYNGSHGGIVGQLGGNNNQIAITGCVFNGKMLGSNVEYWCGILGYYGNNTATISNCLFAPQEVNVKSTNNNTICRNGTTVTVTNCYYTQTMTYLQGKQAYSITPAANTTVALTGTTTHNYAASCSGTGLVFYDNEDANNTFDNGISFNNGSTTTLYAAGDVTANLLLGATTPANSTFFYYSATPGTLSGTSTTGTSDPYTLTMTTANQTVTANYVNQKTSTDWTSHIVAYGNVPTGGITVSSGNVTIGNKEGLAWVISMVNGLNGVTAEEAETYAGLTYTLAADVDMSAHTWVPIGTVEHPFSGTFNGNGHVIKGITRNTEFPHNGLFGYVSGSANIQNVVVQASLTGNSVATGAVVGTFASTGTISNVEGAGTLTGGALTTALGGIAGNNSGTIHSSFAVASLTSNASATMGGLVGVNSGNLYNSYANGTLAGSASIKGGLVGANNSGCNVKNCYAVLGSQTFPAFANTNAGAIEYCYADLANGYVGTNTGTLQNHGTYGNPQSSTKHLDYMYRDNLITLASGTSNTYVPANGTVTYSRNHIPVWNGLVSALNQWVEGNPAGISGLSPWYRPISSHINGDLPVLGFEKDNSLGTLDNDGKFLQYGSNQNGGNGLDAVLTTYNNETASIFHYGKATDVTRVPSANVKVSVAEDAVLLQATSSNPGAFINTTVGVTFDNSDHGQHAYDFWGNKLNYDWHLLSTPLSDLKTGAVHNSYVASGNANSNVDITAIGGYFPNGLITSDNPAVGGDIKWDFYTYYEPQYHWINLKRNKNNHYHQDGGALIPYNETDQDEGGNTAQYIPGKGYEMAINQVTYMNATGTLNRGYVPIALTNGEPDNINYAKGWNLVGNPYQAYLDIDMVNMNPIYTYDADQGTFVPYTKSASDNPEIVSQYIHPHQAFFVHTAAAATLTFQQTMATTETASGSYFRDGKVNYPLVNLFAEDETGHRDLTVIEFHRPELGGAAKLDYMRTAPFTLAAHYAGESYGILFATDDIERVPVKFKPSGDGLITLTWITHNGEFSRLLLVDNKLGVEHNMLADSSYSFMASLDDYSSRFYITYECSGLGIDENDDGGGSTATAATFAYINNGNIVVDIGSGHGASLEVIDVLGRVLYSRSGLDGACTVSTNGFAKGVYILRLSSNQGVKTQKIVVQ